MREELLTNPVFFIGMPRSGTTLVFEAFARHPDLAWPSNYTDQYPQLPWLNAIGPLLRNRWIDLSARKKQYGKPPLGNRFVPHPAEAYGFWNLYSGVDFAGNYLRGVSVPPATIRRLREASAALARWQRRRRFTAKLTGPSRMDFLTQVFPDARFIHVIRDGRAVVHSLLRVRFWKRLGGLEAPFWHGGFPPEMLAEWERAGRDPGLLAALQWKHVVSATRQEGRALGPERYAEIRYEDFVPAPIASISRLYAFSGLAASERATAFLDSGPGVRNMNDKYLQDFEPGYADRLTASMQPVLREAGYGEDAGLRPSSASRR